MARVSAQLVLPVHECKGGPLLERIQHRQLRAWLVDVHLGCLIRAQLLDEDARLQLIDEDVVEAGQDDHVGLRSVLLHLLHEAKLAV